MLYTDWIRDKQGIFTEMVKIEPLPFIYECGAENVDTLYKIKYGSRTVARNITHLTPRDVARITLASYRDKWSNKYALLKGIEIGVDSKTLVDETVNDDIKRISSSKQTNEVSAFNDEDDDVATKDVQADLVNDDVQKDSTRNITKTHKSINAIKTQLDLLNSNFIEDVFEDVNKIVFISIYE